MARRKSSEEILIQLLARRSMHLPGNGWCQDWSQYMRNNHPLFGICLHHSLHPLETWERMIALVGSIAFGLMATNIAYLLKGCDQEGMGDVIFVWTNDDDVHVITMGMVLLWTFGGVLHSLYDLTVWHVMACACCHPGGSFGNHERCKDCGSYILIPVTLGIVALATYAVLNRASCTSTQEQGEYDAQGGGDDGQGGAEAEGYVDDESPWSDIEGVESFSFLMGYWVELCLAWFVYFPIVGTVLFSGILGCNGRLPILGGRPRDVRLQENDEGLSYSRMGSSSAAVA